MKAIVYLVVGILVLILLGWLGLQIQPAPFPTFVCGQVSKTCVIPLALGWSLDGL